MIYSCSQCGRKGEASNPISNTEIKCMCGNRIMLVICNECKSSYTISISGISPNRYSFNCKKCPAKLFFYVKEDFHIEPVQEYPQTILNVPKEDYPKKDYSEDYKEKSKIEKRKKEKRDIFKNIKPLFANFNYIAIGIIFTFVIFALETMFKNFGTYFFNVANFGIGLVVLFVPFLIMLQLCIYISSYGYFKSIGLNFAGEEHYAGSVNLHPFFKILICSLVITLLSLIALKSIELLPISDPTIFPSFLSIVYIVFLILGVIVNGILWFYPCKLALKSKKGSESFLTFFDWCAFGFFLSVILAIIMGFILIMISFPALLLENKFFIFKYGIEIVKYVLLSLAFGFLFKLTSVFYVNINSEH